MFQEFSRNHQIDKISKILTSRKEEEFPNKEWKIIVYGTVWRVEK